MRSLIAATALSLAMAAAPIAASVTYAPFSDGASVGAKAVLFDLGAYNHTGYNQTQPTRLPGKRIDPRLS